MDCRLMARRWHHLARVSTALAIYALDRYSLLTDLPAHGAVVAADCLDSADRHLAVSGEEGSEGEP